jgi:hypothetical protein
VHVQDVYAKAFHSIEEFGLIGHRVLRRVRGVALIKTTEVHNLVAEGGLGLAKATHVRGNPAGRPEFWSIMGDAHGNGLVIDASYQSESDS